MRVIACIVTVVMGHTPTEQYVLSEASRPAGVAPDLLDFDPNESTAFGELVIEDTLHVGGSSIIHTAHLEPWEDSFPIPLRGLVIKYIDDCRLRMSGLPTDLVVNEYLMLHRLNGSGLTPNVYFLSDPAIVDQSMQTVPKRLESELLEHNFADCAARGTNVRFMLMDMVGPSVSAYMQGMKSNPTLYSSSECTRRVLVICKKLVSLLKQLNAFGIVHADVHFGNVAFKRPVASLADINVDTDELVLLDFEYATPVGQRPEASRTENLRPQLLSPWQLMNEPSGPRDDVYRALLVTADWISRQRFMKGYASLLRANLEMNGNPARGSANYKNIRREFTKFIRTLVPLFTCSYLLGSAGVIGEGVPVELHDPIRNRLEGLHKWVTACNQPETPMDFDHIDSELENTVSLFR